MRAVKTKATLHEVDINYRMLVITNRRTSASRPYAFEDLEADVHAIPTPPAAPREVGDLITTAKNLILYSWYYFPFVMLAAFQASSALERALKIRLKAKPRDTLKYLLREAVEKGLLTNAGFPRWKSRNEGFARWHDLPPAEQTKHFVDLLVSSMPEFRNSVAHGEGMLLDIGLLQLDIACEAIEQLYPAKRVTHQ